MIGVGLGYTKEMRLDSCLNGWQEEQCYKNDIWIKKYFNKAAFYCLLNFIHETMYKIMKSDFGN